MDEDQYIYTFRYDATESDLCKLESKYIFNIEERNKQLFSNFKIEPSISPFIKRRLDIISSSKEYSTLLSLIKKENIKTDGFKIEYLVLDGDSTGNTDRLNRVREVAYCIDTYPDYYNPSITYSICYYDCIWYFGILNKNNFDWQKHKHKPHSYSNSISINIAKALVNIASNASQEYKLFDACCGVGTIMIEACFSGFAIEGCDISAKTCKNARENLAFFNYTAQVYCSDIKDIKNKYDAVILDLPYNLYTAVSQSELINIIKSSAKLSDRLVIVSTSDISDLINTTELTISEHCDVSKRGKVSFTRRIWICEFNNNKSK